MFRVKTELATKTSYAELTPTDESLYSLPGSAALTATSAVIYTAMTSGSVYSQDSWKTASPSVSVYVVDHRQATSPTVQWSDIAEEVSDKGFSSKSPSMPSVSTPPQDVSFPMVMDDTVSHSKSDFVPSLANNAVRESIRSHDVDHDVGLPRPLGKRLTKMFTKIIKPQSNKKIEQHSLELHSPKHSRSPKTFRKVVNRLSFRS